jgi:hypothetical protein
MANVKDSFRYWQAVYAAFYSRHLYRSVTKFWRGWGIGYLVLIIAIGALPLSTRIILELNQFFKDDILFPLEQLPKLTIQNGALVWNHAMPYFIQNKAHEVVAIIDTAGDIAQMKNNYPQCNLMITRHHLYFRPPSVSQFLNASKDYTHNKMYTYSWDAQRNGYLDSVQWIKTSGITKLIILLEILVFPFVTVFYLGLYVLFLLIFAILGQFVADICLGVSLSIQESFRLMVVAATPQILCLFLFRTANIVFPALSLVYLGLLVSYYFYAVLSLKFINRDRA